MAFCPAHDDRNASLSVHVSDGRILLHCHAGCSTEDVVNALGLTMSDLFVESKKTRPKIVASYPYPDERGNVLFEVVRFDPKAFKQRKPDGRGGAGCGTSTESGMFSTIFQRSSGQATCSFLRVRRIAKLADGSAS